MRETILDSILKLFALIARVDGISRTEFQVVERFLKENLPRTEVERWMQRFEQYASSLRDDQLPLLSSQLNDELSLQQKYIVIYRLLVLVFSDRQFHPEEDAMVALVAEKFHLPPAFPADIRRFVLAEAPVDADMERVLSIGPEHAVPVAFARHLHMPSLNGNLLVYWVQEVDMFFIKHIGQDVIRLNYRPVRRGSIYIVSPGGVIQLSDDEYLYYSDLLQAFLADGIEKPVHLTVREVSYLFQGGKKGVHPISFEARSGQMVAIMGASGSGKSTLLSLLNGNMVPQSGEVTVNGHDLHQHIKDMRSLIGYVPQDDLLMEDLTVFQNLYYNARLVHGDYSETQLSRLVMQVLDSLGLSDIRDLKVGSALNKTISGGQRKRLNIGLELLRQPSIIFFDEPTSGLSSRDSQNIIDILSELTVRGKLVFVVIHQPSSEIFKKFDELLLLDAGGYPVYVGKPVEAIRYFREAVDYIAAGEPVCRTCGNIRTEEVFDIVETRVVDEYGNETGRRRITPFEWYQRYLSHRSAMASDFLREDLPPHDFNRPGWLEQWRVFFTRGMMAKFSNTPYMATNLLIGPVLALVLALICRYHPGGDDLLKGYVFGRNSNVPAYLFMSVIVALFIGMTIASSEIFRDARIRRREAFLQLSKSAYLTAKVALLMLFTAIQMALFLAVANPVLEIPGFHLHYWLVLFLASVFAILLGLNISSMFRNIATIYIFVPLLLIPQIILSGTIVRFDRINPGFTSLRKVPLVAEFIASRWAYEALVVKYYRDNPFEKQRWQVQCRLYEAVYMKDYWASEMEDILEQVHSDAMVYHSQTGEIQENLEMLAGELERLALVRPDLTFGETDAIRSGTFTPALYQSLNTFLVKVKSDFIGEYVSAVEQRDTLQAQLLRKYGDATGLAIYMLHEHNQALEDLVLNKDHTEKIARTDQGLVRLFYPIYFKNMYPEHFLDFRAHFYAPYKYFAGVYVDTFFLNLAMLLLMGIGLYITLYYDVFGRLLRMLPVNLF